MSDWAEKRAVEIIIDWTNDPYRGGNDSQATRLAQALREARAEGMAAIAELVQAHAEGGNIENYTHLSDKIRRLSGTESKDG